MPARAIVLTALIASSVSSIVAFSLGLLAAFVLLQAPSAAAQTATPTATQPSSPPASQTNAAPVLRAQRFELVDASGSVVAVLGRQGPRQDTRSTNIDSRTGLELLDANGRPRAGLALGDDGQAAIFVQNERGGLVALGQGRLTPVSQSSDGLGLLIADATAGSVLALGIGDGQPVWQMGRFDTGAGLAATIGNDGTPQLAIAGPGGQIVWQAP